MLGHVRQACGLFFSDGVGRFDSSVVFGISLFVFVVTFPIFFGFLLWARSQCGEKVFGGFQIAGAILLLQLSFDYFVVGNYENLFPMSPLLALVGAGFFASRISKYEFGSA
ncbi:MAG: hypothetical protein CMO55_26695 [Verrucomicrobiales bacterium]|nr:hypothetical protein [Verrucomicrobiales bacterium]